MTAQEETTLTIDEINSQFDGEWLLVRVIESGRDSLVEGSVLAHDTDRETIAALLPRAQDQQPRPSLAFFRAHAN